MGPFGLTDPFHKINIFPPHSIFSAITDKRNFITFWRKGHGCLRRRSINLKTHRQRSFPFPFFQFCNHKITASQITGINIKFVSCIINIKGGFTIFCNQIFVKKHGNGPGAIYQVGRKNILIQFCIIIIIICRGGKRPSWGKQHFMSVCSQNFRIIISPRINVTANIFDIYPQCILCKNYRCITFFDTFIG